MIYLFILNLLISLVLGYFIYYSYKKSIYQSQCLLGNFTVSLNRYTEKLEHNINDLEQSINDQKEVNKYFTIEQAQQDKALIQLIDMPYLYDELEPGWPKEWSGDIPFPIKEEYIGSELKLNYIYTIKEVKDNHLEISRK